MELRHLQHFVAVAEELSFTRAASRVNIVQSGLSMSIRNLEAELGVPLFVRGTQQIALSAAGQAMLPEARRAIAAVEAAKKSAAYADGVLRGQLRVGIGQTSPDGGRMARVLGEFHARHHDVAITVRQGSAGDLLERVGSGDLDLAVCGRPLTAIDGVTEIMLMRAPFFLAVPKDNPLARETSVTLNDIAGEPFVDMLPGWVARDLTDQTFANLRLERTVACEVDDAVLLFQLVECGLGVSLVPGVAREMKGRVRLIPLQASFPDWQLIVAFAGEEPANPAANLLLEMVAAEWLKA